MVLVTFSKHVNGTFLIYKIIFVLFQLPSLLTELDRPRCQLKLLNNGKRGLEVDTVIPAEQALIEFKGKVMLQQQFLQENDFHKRYVFFFLT